MHIIPSALRISPEGKIGISECTYGDSHKFLKYHSDKAVLEPKFFRNLPYQHTEVIKCRRNEEIYAVASENHVMVLDKNFERVYEFDIPYYEDICVQTIEYMEKGKLLIGDNYGFVHIYSMGEKKLKRPSIL